MTESAHVSVPTAPRGRLHIALWIVQGLLTLTFGVAGVMKATAPIADLAQNMPWTTAVPEGLVRFIGVCEFLGALGMLLPSLTRIAPFLTPLAGVGLSIIMLLAMVFHLSRAEWSGPPINVALLALAAFVAWGRFRRAPIPPRGR